MVSSKTKVRSKLLTSLDGVYRCIRKWTHGTGYEADNHMLVGWQLRQLRLLSVGKFLQFLICSEVRACVVVSQYHLHGRMPGPTHPDWLLAGER
jgi:hypothetical protein